MGRGDEHLLTGLEGVIVSRLPAHFVRGLAFL
jgi:hypothetical protein